MAIRDSCAIVGLGLTPTGRVPGRSALSLVVEAAVNAIADSGLGREEIDGICLHTPPTDRTVDGWRLAELLGISAQMRFVSNFPSRGTSPSSAVKEAVMAIELGIANNVLCAFADDSYSLTHGGTYQQSRGLGATYGMFGVASAFAMHATRHMALYGTTQDQLGAIAIAHRQHAQRNPTAQFYGRPITMDDYHQSRWVVKPLHLLDCCLVSDGGRAAVVSRADRARSLRQPPVHILGMGQGNMITELGTLSGADCAAQAFGMAGITHDDVDMVQLYDGFTILAMMQIEDLGFCKKGEGGPFVADGKLGPDGSLPTDTGGGMLADYYLQGWTALTEGVIQMRGAGGQRQIPNARVCLVSGNSGTLLSCLILRRD